jgi:UDP-glucose 6-dehydrogenase
VLPHHLDGFDVVLNPEFLRRATAAQDFVEPAFLLLGGRRAAEVADLYKRHSAVKADRVFITDVKTSAMVKYTINSFGALKVTFMNEMHEVAKAAGADWGTLVDILGCHPVMGAHHLQVPGPDGLRGFGGPCLPKDTAALVKEYDVEILKKVLELNEVYRKGDLSEGGLGVNP